MRSFFTCLALCAGPAFASDCWVAANFVGHSAQADREYQFARDNFSDGMRICFTEEGGIVTGSDLQLYRFGISTLIGYGSNGHGLETVNVYQIDRERQKLLLSQSRMGTDTVTSLLPDYAATFVADVVPAP